MEDNNVFTVASIDEDNILSSHSNWGNPPIDFAAPGESIESLKPGGGTWTWSGCSMATGMVSGILLFGLPVISGYETSTGITYPIAHLP